MEQFFPAPAPTSGEFSELSDAIKNKTITPTKDTTNFTSGSIECVRSGNVVTVSIGNAYFVSGSSLTLATGLPTAAEQVNAFFGGSNAAQTARLLGVGNSCWIGKNSTTLQAHIGGITDQPHWASITYITSDP